MAINAYFSPYTINERLAQENGTALFMSHGKACSDYVSWAHGQTISCEVQDVDGIRQKEEKWCSRFVATEVTTHNYYAHSALCDGRTGPRQVHR